MTSPWVAVSVHAIADRWRPLTALEEPIAETLIQDAQDILETDLEDLGVTSAPDPTDSRWERMYVRTIANAVRGLLSNPEGFLVEESDGYRYERDRTLAAGALSASDEDLRRLLPKSRRRTRGAFSITPV